MEAHAYWGKFRGLVTNVDDPAGLGRIRANVPSVLHGLETGWALPCVPYAGEGVGFHLIPPVGAGVWIEFESGETSAPVWTGCWWGEGQMPEEATPEIKIIKTAAHTLILDDTPGGEKIELRHADGSVLRMDSDGIRLAHEGGAALHIDASSITMDNNGPRVILEASSITLNNNGRKIELGSASVTINGTSLEVM
ncbi:phage baseplate assembly protein V [Arthrobacter antioxidans]|uniref:phage baseplate assembly protein V n=1 Tax=Arthrobacter antioxidans TaxID=2895818 RepID=UPI001FFE5EF1|nr:phage baseplate assembly protein V [Arthrobacter antioxidans]